MFVAYLVHIFWTLFPCDSGPSKLLKISVGGSSVTARPIEKQLYKGMFVARTTDACTLTVMEDVKKSYYNLLTYFEKVIQHAGNETYVPDAEIRTHDGALQTTFPNKIGHGTTLGRSVRRLRVHTKIVWGPGCQNYN